MKYWLVVGMLVVNYSVGFAQERIKIGYVDIQRVIGESQAGKRARDRFQAQVKKAEADLVKERQDIERLKIILEFVDIALVPIIVAAAALVLGALRLRRWRQRPPIVA